MKNKCHFDDIKPNKDGQISHSYGYTIDQNDVVDTKVAYKRKKRATAKIKPNSSICEGKVSIDLPLQTVSEANCFEPWRKKHARHKDQQRCVALFLNPLRSKIKLPCSIMLTRFAPDELDRFDNLPVSFKYIVDAVCAIITGNHKAGRADSDKRISIACDQIKSKEYGIRIEITF